MKIYSERIIEEKDAIDLGLNSEEYARVLEILKRPPSLTEIGIFSALWSEHCCYKNSIRLLKTFPTKSSRSLVATGQENAGVLDIGEGWAIVFKMESHNHPTAISPYNGAATAIGGIMRDIFSMGARPICSMNFLCFGSPQVKNINEQQQKESAKNRNLLTNAVSGIADYGNSLGIPVIGGKTIFDASYARNCLVNALSLGIVRHKDLMRKRIDDSEGSVYIVGTLTGRDGVQGASFASSNLHSKSEDRKAQIQIGDPFKEKLLMEATLEALQTGAIIGLQDMGAAGLSCCAAELSAESNCGMEIDLDLVPLREPNLSAFEIMLSESQERMLVILRKGHETSVHEIFDKWELSYACIGQLTKEPYLTVIHHNHIVARIPPQELVLGGGAPQYMREAKKPERLRKTVKLCFKDSLTTQEMPTIFTTFISHPNMASRRFIYEQYDCDVGLVKVNGPGMQPAMICMPKNRNKKIALSITCNPRYVSQDPYLGSLEAVFSSARKLVCSGAKLLGITNCLNYANPENPENYFFLKESVRGICEACSILQIPVTGGNVSLYNESERGPILPTPTIGMVGLLENAPVSMYFSQANNIIACIGEFSPRLDCSEYLQQFHYKCDGLPPQVNSDYQKRLIKCLSEIANSQSGLSLHDIGRGGLAASLFYSSYNEISGKCFGLQLHKQEMTNLVKHNSLAQIYFGEMSGCVLATIAEDQSDQVYKTCSKFSIPYKPIGTVISDDVLNFGLFHVQQSAVIQEYEKGLTCVLN